MQGQRYWVERAFEDAKGECGLADYQALGWRPWHHHVTMVMLAMLFIVEQRVAQQPGLEMLTPRDIVEMLKETLPRKPEGREALVARINERHARRRGAIESRFRNQHKRDWGRQNPSPGNVTLSNSDRKNIGSPCGGAHNVAVSTLARIPISTNSMLRAMTRPTDVAGYFRSINRPPSTGKCRVIFVDEAHALAKMKGLFDSLLKSIEELEDNVIYCFATTEFDRMPAALISRLAILEIRKLDTAEAIRFLNRIAAKEGIICEPEALALIAGLADGQPRDLLQRLDQMWTLVKS